MTPELNEEDKQALNAASNGHTDAHNAPAHEEGDEHADTVEVPREQLDALLSRVEDLEEEIEKERQIREKMVNNLIERREALEERVSDLEEEEEKEDYAPRNKTEKAKKLIVDNFDSWAVSLKAGKAVVTQVKERSRNREEAKKGREGKSVHQYIFTAMSEEYGENIEYEQVHNAMKSLGRSEEFRLVEDDRKMLFRAD